MLTLITFPGGFGDPSFSPFCLKAMILLEMSGQPWKPEFVVNTSDAPLGRLPALRTPEGVIPESAFIQRYLEQQGANFYGGLPTRRRAVAHALIRTVEESLRLGVVYDRWLDDRCWNDMKKELFAGISGPLRPAIATMLRRQVRAGLKSQGIGRMSEAQRMDVFAADLECLTDHLWETPYLLGDTPTPADASAVPVLSMLDRLPANTALRQAVRGNATLMSYIHRGREELYPKLNPVAVAA